MLGRGRGGSVRLADDAGAPAASVREPVAKPSARAYDPTCGSGGMLLEATQLLKAKGQDPRALALYGQTWAIAEINLFLHNIDDAFIAKGDTILDPKRYDPHAQEFVPGIGAYDRVMANPPFSERKGKVLVVNGDATFPRRKPFRLLRG